MVRIKQRYLLLQAIPSGYGKQSEITKGEFGKMVLQTVQKYYGTFGVGCCSKMSVIYSNWIKTGIVILRIRFERLEMMKNVLSFIGTEKDPFPYKFTLIHVSGTVRSCKRSAILYDVDCVKLE